MRVTNIRIQGVKATQAQTDRIVKAISKQLKAAGFITNVRSFSATSITLGLHMKSFVIDTDKLGYNARMHGGYNGLGMQLSLSGTLASFKRTSLPTWDQRVKFNDIVNDALDAANATARVVSGPFIVRDVKQGRYDEQAWLGMVPSYADPDQIQTLTAEMQAEANEARKAHKRRLAAIARDRKQGRLVEVSMRYGDAVRDTQVMTMTEYQEYRSQMSTGDFHTHEARRVGHLKLA